MPADMNTRLNRVLVGISQNEALMEGLETEAATTLLDWASTLARPIVYETIELDDEDAADELMYPRLRALRQMMRQANLLASGQALTDPETAAATFDRLIAQATLVYGPQFASPGVEDTSAFLNIPPANTAEWITSLQAWLEHTPPPDLTEQP